MSHPKVWADAGVITPIVPVPEGAGDYLRTVSVASDRRLKFGADGTWVCKCVGFGREPGRCRKGPWTAM